MTWKEFTGLVERLLSDAHLGHNTNIVVTLSKDKIMVVPLVSIVQEEIDLEEGSPKQKLSKVVIT